MNRIERIVGPLEPAAALGARADIPSLGEIGLDRFAPYLLNRIVARWNGDLALRLKAHGLSTIQMRTLAVLSVMPGATVNELAVHTMTEQSTMSRALDGIEREGLICRRHREGDMRVREVHVTEAGNETFRRFWPEMHGAFREMFAGLSEGEYEALAGLLARVLDTVRDDEV
jgi:DNA-binding MarR family transcriptional regulator